MSAFDTARDIRDAHKAAIMALPSVVGSGVGMNVDGDASIHIYLGGDALLAAYSDLIPHIEGVPVGWQVAGPIVAAARAESVS